MSIGIKKYRHFPIPDFYRFFLKKRQESFQNLLVALFLRIKISAETKKVRLPIVLQTVKTDSDSDFLLSRYSGKTDKNY
jgi:hypothetical protein